MANKQRFLVSHGLDNNSKTIINVSDPINSQDVSTKNYSSNASNLTSGTVAIERLPIVSVGSSTTGILDYSGTTATVGKWYGGTAMPVGTTRLNYNGDLYSTTIQVGPGRTGVSSVGLLGGGTLAGRNAANTAYAFLTLSGTNVDISINDIPKLQVTDTSIKVNDQLQIQSSLLAGGSAGTTGQVLTSTGTGVQWSTLPTPSSGVSAGSTTSGYVTYSGTTSTDSQWNSSTTFPTGTQRLNYNGDLYATTLQVGSGRAGMSSIGVIGTNGGSVSGRNAANTGYQYLTLSGSVVGLAASSDNGATVTELVNLQNGNVTISGKLILNNTVSAGGSFGSSGQVLTSTGTGVQWTTPASTGVTSFNTRTGAVTLTSSDVTTALGYTPASTAPVGQTAGSASTGYVTYSGTTSTAGQWDGSSTAPSSTTRLNYNGNLYANEFFSSTEYSILNASGGTVHARNTGDTAYTYLTLSGSTIGLAASSNGGSTVTELIKLENGTVLVTGSLIHVSSTLTTSTTTANQIVDSTPISGIRTVKYIIQVTSGAAYQSTELLVIHDGTTAYLTEYATVATGANLATFDADISSANLRLLVTPVNAATTVKVSKVCINT